MYRDPLTGPYFLIARRRDHVTDMSTAVVLWLFTELSSVRRHVQQVHATVCGRLPRGCGQFETHR